METSKLIYRAEGHDLVRPAADDYFVISKDNLIFLFLSFKKSEKLLHVLFIDLKSYLVRF